MNDKKDLCSCGHPQSHPVPHEHDRDTPKPKSDITKGTWKVKRVEQPARREFWIGSPTGRTLIARITRNSDDDKEAKANAHLIAEAGTVHNDTGYTPRQLAEQNKELSADCKDKARFISELAQKNERLREDVLRVEGQKQALLDALKDCARSMKAAPSHRFLGSRDLENATKAIKAATA